MFRIHAKISSSLWTSTPGATSLTATPVALAICLPRLNACTATCWSVSLTSQFGLMTGLMLVSLDVMVTLPRESGATRAMLMEKYCPGPGLGPKMPDVVMYSISGQSGGNSESVARSERVRALRELLGSFSQPNHRVRCARRLTFLRVSPYPRSHWLGLTEARYGSLHIPLVQHFDMPHRRCSAVGCS